MNPLDDKINTHFPGLVVRKDLVKQVKGNAIVPSYVLEYLLGKYCATSDEASIQSGVETVREILRKHYVHRSEAGLVRSTIRERGRHKVIDKVSFDLNDKRDVYEATFADLGIKGVLVDAETIKQHPKLLVSGVWCIADLEYEHSEDRNVSPWILASLKPIQLSNFNFDEYVAARRHFSSDDWIDLLMQSIGFDPHFFGRRTKLLQLARLIPYCERNYNLIELGPKGTGKSHIYSEFSPHGILISGGEVTVAKLFVNNASGRIGLVGYWDTVAFDEFAGKTKRADKALVDILKNYMANKSFSRGIETLGAEASMVFVGNTQHTLPYMLRHSDLFDDSAAPVPRLRLFRSPALLYPRLGGGHHPRRDVLRRLWLVCYLAEILRNLRNRDYAHLYTDHFQLLEEISTRDRTAIQKAFSGLMKVLYPHGEATADEVEELLRFAIEGRKRVKDQLMRIDPTYADVTFGYRNGSGRIQTVKTLEEDLHPHHYYREFQEEAQPAEIAPQQPAAHLSTAAAPTAAGPQEAHLTFYENQKGVSYEALFADYLKDARQIALTEPYIRLFFQVRNLMELMETLAKIKADDVEISVHLVTGKDVYNGDQQTEYLEQIQRACVGVGIRLTWSFDDTIHARHIVTDHGWKISLDRGLDIFQRYEMNDAFDFANRLQRFRTCKAFEVTYLRVEGTTEPT